MGGRGTGKKLSENGKRGDGRETDAQKCNSCYPFPYFFCLFAWFCLVIVLLGLSHAGKRKGGEKKERYNLFLLYFRPRPVKISFSAFPPLIKEALLCYTKSGTMSHCAHSTFPLFPADGKEKKVFKQSVPPSAPPRPSPPPSCQAFSLFSVCLLRGEGEG